MNKPLPAMACGARAAALVALALGATPALAYVGPGAGLGVLGTLFGILAAVVLAMFGLFWYPLKRVLGRKPAAVEGGEPERPAVEPEEDDRAR